MSVLYKHIIQVENKNVGLKVGGHKHTIAPPIKQVGGTCPPCPPRFLRQCILLLLLQLLQMFRILKLLTQEALDYELGVFWPF